MENNQIVIYQTSDGKASIQVKLEQDSVWLNQVQMVELFQQSKQNISLHIKNIFKEQELTEISVVKDSLTTAADGKNYKTRYYNLDVIISVGYRIKSQRGTQFRIWANLVLKDYLTKGYAIDQKRFQEQSRQPEAYKQTVELLSNVVASKVSTSMKRNRRLFSTRNRS